MQKEDNQPLVSVVIPCYNAEDFVEEAVRSIMTQSYSNLQIILLDDCSTDKTGDILIRLEQEDNRIIYCKNSTNLKLIETLNKGITLATGEYIARMDADDISMPLRLAKQVEYLEANPDCGVVGTSGMYLDNDLITGKFCKPVMDQQIKEELFFDSPFIHPSIMMRKSLTPVYDSHFYQVEDYALWVKLSKVTKFHNIPEALIKYRILKNSETRKSQSDHLGRHSALKNVHDYLFKVNNILLNSDEMDQYTYSMYKFNFSKIEPPVLKAVYDKIVAKTTSGVRMRLAERWFATFILSRHSMRNFLFYLSTYYTYIGMLSVCVKRMKDVFS
ncbi:glycosyltransferase family 2 protein [Sphingobacterium prati]|uniref:glycosyltransferase family 2 protein n=1 Tax=Sphingobacterium prati TaxID=2737006 RepID=UPI001557C9E6|nr:glycosyltransferase family 2 protein [Sphingobacterium prati]NPE45858.1 glycosyltransferase family 2 protein [Sphingobacterium prati]